MADIAAGMTKPEPDVESTKHYGHQDKGTLTTHDQLKLALSKQLIKYNQDRVCSDVSNILARIMVSACRRTEITLSEEPLFSHIQRAVEDAKRDVVRVHAPVSTGELALEKLLTELILLVVNDKIKLSKPLTLGPEHAFGKSPSEQFPGSILCSTLFDVPGKSC